MDQKSSTGSNKKKNRPFGRLFYSRETTSLVEKNISPYLKSYFIKNKIQEKIFQILIIPKTSNKDLSLYPLSR